MRNRRTKRCLLALLAAVGLLSLAGCGSGLVLGVGVGEGSSRPAPLVGRYVGSLSHLEGSPRLDFRLTRDGLATGEIRFTTGAAVPLTGRVDADCELTLGNGDYAIVGGFTGAYHPQDPSIYDSRGWRFVGEWERDGEGGTAVAWHEQWPPALVHYDNDDWWDDSPGYDWGGGGSTGGGSTGGSTGGGSTGGGSTGGGSTGGGSTGGSDPGDPLDSSGDPFDDPIILRSPEGVPLD